MLYQLVKPAQSETKLRGKPATLPFFPPESQMKSPRTKPKVSSFSGLDVACCL